MTCNYRILMKNGDEYSCDGCRLRAFKLFFGLVKNKVRNCYIELSNGERWIYFYGRYRWRWERM